MAVPSEENRHDASTKLAEVSVWLEELEEELDAHLEFLGVVTALDAGTEVLVESLRPQRWFGFSEDPSGE
jgi:hypothetical protein